MMVSFVDDRHAAMGIVAKRLGRVDSRETAADDDDVLLLGLI